MSFTNILRKFYIHINSDYTLDDKDIQYQEQKT